MIRLVLICAAVLGVLASASVARSDAARVIAGLSAIESTWRGGADVTLQLSEGVPFRVFTLDDPPRLVMDFRNLDWGGVAARALLRDTSAISEVRVGAFQPGWSRLVADLTRPMVPQDINMAHDAVTGQARLSLSLVRASGRAFAAASGAPKDALWPQVLPLRGPGRDDRLTVVLDPGHGGIDPGAERAGLSEKDLMLDVAVSVRAALMQAADVDVVLTRDSDIFVPLASRTAIAHHAGGDVFVSLHADALSSGEAEGATLYVLSEAASDTASAYLAARHDRADIIAGSDLTGSDDEVTGILLDLARQETMPRSDALARVLMDSMTQAGGPMNSRPLRRAGFSVLKSADIPSVLIEVGFLSSARDLENLKNPQWRAGMAQAIARGIIDWYQSDTTRRGLIRQ